MDITIEGVEYTINLEKAKEAGLIKPKSLTPATLKQGQKYKHRWNGDAIYMGCVNPDRISLNCMIVYEKGSIVNPPGMPNSQAGFWDEFYEVND